MPRLSLTSSGTSATGESLGEPAVRSVHLETPKPTALAHDARLREPAKVRQGVVWQRALLVCEIVDELCTVVVVLAHVVVVDRLLDQLSGADERVDGVGSSVSWAEERFTVDLADGLPVDFDGWVGPDHLQVEYEPAGLDRLDHVAQDVHDVLRVYSSE
jgi:hypothetical protein